MPRVSIVLLSWNQAQFIRPCLESIAAQTFRDFDVVAIDNGSTDGSADLIEQVSDDLGVPLTLIRNASNEGIPRALNSALRSVTGEFIAPFAADDVMLEHRLDAQVRHLDDRGPDYLAVSGDVALIDPQGMPLTYSPAVWLDPSGELGLVDRAGMPVRESSDVYGAMRTPWLLDEARQLENVIAGNSPLTATAMFRSSAYSTIGTYDESIAFEDYDYWLRITQQSRVAYRPGVVVLYRRHQSNATNRDSFIWDSVLDSLSNVHPASLKEAERAALAESLRKARFRCALAGMAEGLPDSRQRLMRVVRDPSQGGGRRIRAMVSVVHPGLAQRLVGSVGNLS